MPAGVEGGIMNYITPEMLISIIGTLITCLGVMFWFFFQRIYKSMDSIKECIETMKDRLEDRIKTNETHDHELTNRLNELQKEVSGLKCFVYSRHGERA